MVNKRPQYGSVESYSEYFSDILGDVGDDHKYADNVLPGFIDALSSWLSYHKNAQERYKQFAKNLYELMNDGNH